MDSSGKRESGPSSERTRRRMRTPQEKQALVLEALQPGNSVAAVARKHDVNANLLFAWMRRALVSCTRSKLTFEVGLPSNAD